MYHLQLLLTFLLLYSNQDDAIYFQSDKLKGIEWQQNTSLNFIIDDKGEQIEILGKKDEEGHLYWHRRLKTPVCLVGECLLIEIGIYWDLTGDFFGLEVYEEALTKTDHSEFTAEDYKRLIEILENDWSPLREYDLADLVEQPYSESPEVDGTSGATKKEIAEEAVADAVYTTHTIWHLSHVGEKEQLIDLAVRELNKDKDLFSLLMQKDQSSDYISFFLDLFSQNKLEHVEHLNSLVIRSMGFKNKPKIRDKAIRTLSYCNFSDDYFLNKIIDIYHKLPVKEKLQSLNEFKKIKFFPEPLYQAIVNNIENQQEWFIIKVFQVMANRDQFKDKLISLASNLSHIDNPQLQNVLEEYQ